MKSPVKQRKKQATLTRQAILESAGIEFSLHGYSASSIGAIVSRAGLTKGALFHHFPDKEALALGWIRDALSPAIREEWITALAVVDSLDALRLFCRARCLEMRAGDVFSTLVALSAETSMTRPQLGAELEVVRTGLRSSFADLLERGKSATWIHRSIQPMVEASFLVSVFCGFTVTTRCLEDAQARSTCATAAEVYLNTLRPE
jgi:AcrR family transcriptional regulator